jgi:hypothetical protein
LALALADGTGRIRPELEPLFDRYLALPVKDGLLSRLAAAAAPRGTRH